MDQKMQCTALTSKKERCRLVCKQNLSYCHRHEKMVAAGRNIIKYDINNVGNNVRRNVANKHKNVENKNIKNPTIDVNLPGFGLPPVWLNPYWPDPMYQDWPDLPILPNLPNARDWPNLQIDSNNKNNDNNEIYKNQLPEENIPIILNDLNDCQCCFNQIPANEVILCTGANNKYNHITCYECLKGYLDSVLDEKKSVGCMMCTDGCKGRYNDSDVKHVLTEEQYQKYMDCCNVEEAVLFAGILDDYHMCPFCSKYGVVIENVDRLQITQLKINCPRCEKGWCVKCRNEEHTPHQCGKLHTTNVDVIKRMIEQIIDDTAIHKCPKCLLKYNKEDGCNLMTCSSCHTYSCYVCGLIIVPKNKLKYWHFKGSGSADKDAICPLYNNVETNNVEAVKVGNMEYDKLRVTKALERLLEVNADNKEIFNVLYKEIEQKGYIINIATLSLSTQTNRPVARSKNIIDRFRDFFLAY